jgi:hypothetical protein
MQIPEFKSLGGVDQEFFFCTRRDFMKLQHDEISLSWLMWRRVVLYQKISCKLVA